MGVVRAQLRDCREARVVGLSPSSGQRSCGLRLASLSCPHEGGGCYLGMMGGLAF